ncbi:hypothetical protein GCM10028813_20550 [Ramlibacter alkalitolerans]
MSREWPKATVCKVASHRRGGAGGIERQPQRWPCARAALMRRSASCTCTLQLVWKAASAADAQVRASKPQATQGRGTK